MRNFLLLIFSAFMFTANATTFTVSNDINRPAQYSDLQAAIDAAANGDTILVYGSSTNYNTATLIKPLVIIGEGYNSSVSNPASITYVYFNRFNSTLSSSNSTIMGLNIGNIQFNPDFSGSVDGQRILENITVSRCRINSVQAGGYYADSYNNINFINNVINTYVTYNYSNSSLDFTFSNNIFDAAYISGSITRDGSGVITDYINMANVKFYNNLFLNYTTGLLNRVYGAVFESNIFFGHELYYTDYEAITWNHNMFYLVDDTTTPGLFTNNNTGSGNQVDTDPMFVSYPTTPTTFSFSHDYHLQAGSPALTASVSGGEIGIYGGTYPYEVGAAPPVPVVTEITIQDGTSSVPVGGTVNFNFKAKSGN